MRVRVRRGGGILLARACTHAWSGLVDGKNLLHRFPSLFSPPLCAVTSAALFAEHEPLRHLWIGGKIRVDPSANKLTGYI